MQDRLYHNTSGVTIRVFLQLNRTIYSSKISFYLHFKTYKKFKSISKIQKHLIILKENGH